MSVFVDGLRVPGCRGVLPRLPVHTAPPSTLDTIMKSPLRSTCLRLLPLLALALAASSAQANLLVDPGFESNPLTPIGNVLNPPTMPTGVWGHESSAITGSVGAVSPSSGLQMLSMTNAGAVSTQAVQAVNVSSFSGLINGGANFTLSADFNAAQPGAIGGLLMQFFSGGGYGSQIGSFVAGNINVDGNAAGWQTHSISGLIPVGTQTMLAQVYYLNASLGGQAGFVDAADFSITAVPEPTTLAMMGLGGVLVALRQRRQVRQAD